MSTDCKPAIPPNIYWMVSTFWSLNAESPPEHGYIGFGLGYGYGWTHTWN